ncbi:MAG TPA: PAS domain-containing protein, partial [Kofleriaceae bacterium]
MTSAGDRSPAELLAVIADALPAALAYVDAGEYYRYVNRSYTERFGKFGGRVGIRVREALGAELYERIRPYIARALAGESVAFEYEHRHPDGESLLLSVTYVPDPGPDGQVQGYAALLEDITDRRAAERSLERTLAELRSAHHALDAVVGASPAAIMLLDRDGTVRMWNPAAERIYGLSAAEVIGRRMPVIAPGQEAEFEDNLARVTGGEVHEAVEARRMRRGGGMFDAVIWRAPVRGVDGSTQLLSVVADITARRRLEDGLRVLAESSRVLAASLAYHESLERA